MDELDPEARRVLGLAHEARTPSAEDKARVEQRLALALGAAALAAPGAAAAKSALGGAAKAGGFAALKWLGFGSAVLALAVGGYVAFAPRAPVPAPRPQPAAPAQAAAPVQMPPPVEAPQLEAAPSEPALPAPEAKPEPLTRSKSRKAARGPEDPLAAEVTLLHRAQSAWRAGRAQEAESLLREHGQRFPRSALGLERDALQVLTLCELGQKAKAERLAQKLLERAPSSPLRTSIEQSCAMR
jgi:hypothetical protein